MITNLKIVLKKRRLCVSILLQPETFNFLGCRYTKCTKTKTHTDRNIMLLLVKGFFLLYNNHNNNNKLISVIMIIIITIIIIDIVVLRLNLRNSKRVLDLNFLQI